MAHKTAVRPFIKNKFLFDCVGLAIHFFSSRAPWHSAMVACSRDKNWCCLLVEFTNLFLINGTNLENQIVEIRKRAPSYGARRLNCYFRLPSSIGAIQRIIRERGLVRKGRRGYQKTKDLRELKAQYTSANSRDSNIG
jgi:hypothetical protein